VEHARDVSLFEPLAKLRTVAIAERVIQDDGRRNLFFYGNVRTGKWPHRQYPRARAREGIRNAECDQGLIIANENWATSQAGAVHVGVPSGAAKREQGGLSRAIDQSSTCNKRDDRLLKALAA
jgi:hypothetical protein